ncbi:MAG: S24 family peptidase [Prevotella sp.]|jgi:hypothetical protein|nr:S24 family peptidase [Prevotella sp.]
MTINERIELIIKEVYSNNKRAFSRDVGISASVTQNIVGIRQSEPTYKILRKITESLTNINKDWVMYGTGEMLVSEKNYTLDEKVEIALDKEQPAYKQNINIAKPFLCLQHNGLEKAGGFSSAIENGLYENMVIPFINDYDFSLKAHGDSMVNKANPHRNIANNDIVACRFWKNKSHISWGEVYALATLDGYIIKKIIPSSLEGHIRCVSFNEEEGYKAYDLPQSEIFEWAIVVGVFSISMW